MLEALSIGKAALVNHHPVHHEYFARFDRCLFFENDEFSFNEKFEQILKITRDEATSTVELGLLKVSFYHL